VAASGFVLELVYHGRASEHIRTVNHCSVYFRSPIFSRPLDRIPICKRLERLSQGFSLDRPSKHFINLVRVLADPQNGFHEGFRSNRQRNQERGE
jgi:hypothetical protein